jgi:hypothetical protein
LANKILFLGEEERKIFQGTSKEDGASKRDRSEEGEGNCGRLYMLRMKRNERQNLE